jgi:peptidoglycan/xylan/chitin deacetylase (PgdA/CDA1 family)
LSTLIFHRVLPQADELFPGEVDAFRFDQICGWVQQWFNVMPLDAALRQLHAGTLPARAMAITFDDGYADNQAVALPILQRHGLTATFFVATGFLDGGCMWNDKVIEAIRRTDQQQLDLRGIGGLGLEGFALSTPQLRRAAIDAVLGRAKYLAPDWRAEVCDQVLARCGVAVPKDLMMTSQQVQDLRAAGMLIGAHTVTHPILARLAEDEARAEMLQSKLHLEMLLAKPVELFAYPNGKPGEDYGPRDAALAKACGFKAAMSTTWGVSSARSDSFQLPRFTPWDTRRWRFGTRLLGNLVRS